MAKHKAATEITIAQEERSAFAQFVDRYKWHGLAVLVLGAAVILWMQSSSEAAVEKNRADWERLYDARTSDEGAPALARAASQIERADIAAWARLDQAKVLIDEREYAEAEAVLAQNVNTGHALLTSVTFPVGEDGAEDTLLNHMSTRVGIEAAWVKANNVFENDPPPEGSPRVELETDEGKIVLGLYMERAPQHVKNFIDLVESGYYDGTKFHRVKTGGFIQGGDPNSRNPEPDTWGLGGPDKTIPPEESGLVHATGVLAAAKKGGATDSSGSQFYITSSPQYGFDGRYVVYGAVLEGQDVVDAISNAELRTDRAETPITLVTITKARML